MSLTNRIEWRTLLGIVTAGILLAGCPGSPAHRDFGTGGSGGTTDTTTGSGGNADGGDGAAPSDGSNDVKVGADGGGASGVGGMPGATGGVTGGTGGSGTSGGGGGGGGNAGTGGAGGVGGAGAGGTGATGCNDQAGWEPNDTVAQACPLPLATLIDTTVGGSTDANDYFSVAVDKGKVYTVNVWNTTPSGSNITVDAQFMGAGGFSLQMIVPTPIGPLTAASSAGYWDLALTPQAGTLIVHVQGTTGATYRFAVYPSTQDGLAHSALTFEPNNTPNTAAPITLGTAVDTQLAPQDYYDYFQLAVAQGKTYAFGLTITTSACIPVTGSLIADAGDNSVLFPSTIYGPTCVFPGGSGGVATNYGEFTAVSNGRGILGLTLSSTAAYQLVVYPTNPDLVHGADFEPNNTPNTAATLTLGTPIGATINVTDDYYDYYQVPVDAGVTYVLTASDTASSGLFVVKAFFASGATAINQLNVGYAYAVAPSVSQPFTPGSSGMLLVQVIGGSGTCTYTLGVAKQ